MRKRKDNLATLRLRSAVQLWDLEVTKFTTVGMQIRLSLLQGVSG